MNAVTLFAANRECNKQHSHQEIEGLHQQGSGCLSVHVKVTPNADHFLFADSQI